MGLTTSGATYARRDILLHREVTTGVRLLSSRRRPQCWILIAETSQTKMNSGKPKTNVHFTLCKLQLKNCNKYFPGGSDGKESACNAGDLGSIPGSGRSLEKGMAIHSNILSWRIPWTEEPGRLQYMELQRV